jgi:hypothetical protein
LYFIHKLNLHFSCCLHYTSALRHFRMSEWNTRLDICYKYLIMNMIIIFLVWWCWIWAAGVSKLLRCCSGAESFFSKCRFKNFIGFCGFLWLSYSSILQCDDLLWPYVYKIVVYLQPIEHLWLPSRNNSRTFVFDQTVSTVDHAWVPSLPT